MKWTINQLQKSRNKELAIDEVVHADEIKEIDSSIRGVSPIHVTGRADIGAHKVVFDIRLKGHLVLPCSRTLVDVNYPVDVETTETFLFNTSGYETDEEAHQVKGDVVDLMPAIKEILLLEVPMQVFCDDTNAEGAAPQSGKDWEVVREEDKSNRIDPRLAGLAKFFDDNNPSDS
ncbi:YceD family protein [Neobacillus sp. SCS-31]|uniref:YceD family protein n=1 Tax=Neobacillus oceani TaxID=3115292 RepID=UPI003906C587